MDKIVLTQFMSAAVPGDYFGMEPEDSVTVTAWPDKNGWDVDLGDEAFSISRKALSSLNFIASYLDHAGNA